MKNVWKEKLLVTDREDNIVYAGNGVLAYADLWNETPFAYPEGKSESGDILVCFGQNLQQKNEELAAVMEQNLCRSVPQDAENMLLVARVNNQEVKPLLKWNLSTEGEGLQIFLDTIYEQNEIRVLKNGRELIFCLNGQTVSWKLEDNGSAAVLIKDRGIKYFTRPENELSELQTLLTGKSYPPYMDRNLIYGQPLKHFLQKNIYREVHRLDSSRNEIHFAYGGRGLSLKRENLCMQGAEYNVYLFDDTDSLMTEISEKSQKYKQLFSGEIEGLISQPHFNSFRFWGNEESVREMGYLLQKCSITNTTVLLTGESGTGKTFLAGEIHRNSRRSHAPFVHVNCAAIPYQLIESELFGYEEGAFTGARKGGKKGYFELAYGGTLFLDEIGEIPLALQGKLLEVLQSRTYYQVGGTRKLEADVRLIAATNKNLKEMVREKRFREDLYYRINVFPIEIPPLRERRDSLYGIVMDILPDICSRLEIEPLLLSSQAFEKMTQYPWPGNIRELENILEKAAILSDGKIIQPEDVMLSETEPFTAAGVTLQEVVERAERDAIVNALQMFHGDKNKAAKYLDISRSGIFEKVKRYRIQTEEVEGDDFK